MKKFKIYLGVLFAVTFCACSSEQEPIADILSEDVSIVRYMGISIDEAEETLTEFVTLIKAKEGSRVGHELRIANRYSKVINNINSRSGNIDSSYIHVFNFENNEGFALMSGDKRVTPVLAFVENGNLPEFGNIENPGLSIFLEGLEEYYYDSLVNSPLINTSNESRATVTRPTEITLSKKANCNTKWGQGAPYNSDCPMIDGVRAPAGCVAVATAQLMSVYKHPMTYKSSSYNWQEMTRYGNANYCNTTAQSQIADLMYQLGKSENLSMSYGKSESGAKIHFVINALRNMGYSNGGRNIEYSEKDVVSDLGLGYPVLLSGYNTKHDVKILGITIGSSLADGHAWLADGYAKFFKAVDVVDDNGRILSSTWYTTYYIRCNWGWNGQYDGYFLSGAFSATSGPSFPDDYNGRAQDYNFKYNVTSIVGVRK